MLVRYKLGHGINRGNLLRTARRHINDPYKIKLGELRLRVKALNLELEAAKISGWQNRKKHLLECSKDARAKGEEVAAEQILDIIQQEKNRSFWRKIRYTIGNARGRSVSEVQVQENDGSVVEHTTPAAVQTAIWDQIHRKRFYLVEEAPICKGELRGEFGYLSVSPSAQAILNGTYLYPPDFDEDTKDICCECTRIRSHIPINSVHADVDEECWSRGWGKAKEDTSFSESGLHFGHYKASTKETILAQFHALKALLVMKHGLVGYQ